MTELLRELEAVMGLADKATPGPWVANDGELATDLYWANGSMTADALAEFADGLSDPPNASFVAAAVNFLRTHHAEIAEAVRDARRFNALEGYCKAVDFHPDAELGEGVALVFMLPAGSSVYPGNLGKTIDAHNSAREVGE